jgi:hypothetical protein
VLKAQFHDLFGGKNPEKFGVRRGRSCKKIDFKGRKLRGIAAGNNPGTTAPFFTTKFDDIPSVPFVPT